MQPRFPMFCVYFCLSASLSHSLCSLSRVIPDYANPYRILVFRSLCGVAEQTTSNRGDNKTEKRNERDQPRHSREMRSNKRNGGKGEQRFTDDQETRGETGASSLTWRPRGTRCHTHITLLESLREPPQHATFHPYRPLQSHSDNRHLPRRKRVY